MSESQPLLRWAGSKKRQFNSFKEYFPAHFETYAEPFAGSAAFLFRIGPRKAKISDINADLFDFYRYVKQSPKELYSEFRKIPRTAETYYRVRTKFNSLPRGRTRTQYFYFLNRNCFNGIYRVNRRGAFNVPFSDDRVSPYLDADEFERSCQIIARTKLYNKDFEPFCRASISTGDFVFLDPPYYRLGSRIFNEYGVSEFVPADFARLSELLDHLDRVGAKFLLSFPRTRESIALARHWNLAQRYVRRTIAGDASARRKQVEMLIFNYDQSHA
jgi:DNA adenine methylase